jgi:hypothetical protein
VLIFGIHPFSLRINFDQSLTKFCSYCLAPNNYGLWADVCGNKFLFGNKIVKDKNCPLRDQLQLSKIKY